VHRALVDRAKQGDTEAFDTLARQVGDGCMAIAIRILRDADQAEDAVQQTLVAIWRDLPSLRDPDRFDAWTYRMVVRQCRAEARRHRRSVSVVDLSDELATTVDTIGEVAMRDQLERAFTALSHDHRVVVVLHHYVGLSLAEIAEILDVPYGTVGSRLHHAMRSMRATIEATDRTVIPGGQPA
jgi:RNA polymerase sigma-70 factor (ECF subfamily)